MVATKRTVGWKEREMARFRFLVAEAKGVGVRVDWLLILLVYLGHGDSDLRARCSQSNGYRVVERF